MSTFYLLPSRPQLGERFAGFLQALFPGVEWGSSAWANLADLLGEVLRDQPGVYVVYGEELPAGQELSETLASAFGAEEGDAVIEIEAGRNTMEFTAQRWQIRKAA